MKKFFLFVAVAFIVASCTLNEKVIFNNNSGGEISYELDGSSFVDMMKMMDTTGQSYSFGDSLFEYKIIAETLKGVKGISNVRYVSDTSKVFLSFSFDDADALNRAHKILGGDTEVIKNNSKYEKVSVKKKNEYVYHTWPLGESAKDTSVESMAMMFTYNLDATFPKAIKSTSGKNISISGNNLKWASSAGDMGGEYAFDGIKVKLGK